jgi:hypothetical protein
MPEHFDGGEVERSRSIDETERDYVGLVAAGAEDARLEATLERADREATEREVDLEAILVRQLRANSSPPSLLVCRLREINSQRRSRGSPIVETSWKPRPARNQSYPPESGPSKPAHAA